MNALEKEVTSNLWGINEVAEYLGVPASTLYQWRAKRYGPPGRRIGKYVKYMPDEVRSWARKQPEGIV
jgi:predicted DNA-binding transcriptional regulator AlpA